MTAKSADTTPTLSLRLLRFVSTIIVPLTFLTFIGCDRQDPSGNLETAKKTQAAPPAEVSVVTISQKTLPVTFEAVGQTEGSREVEVRARVGEFLLRRCYSEGAFVKQGTLLFKIDPAPYEAALNKVKGILKQEEAQLEKHRTQSQGFDMEVIASLAPLPRPCRRSTAWYRGKRWARSFPPPMW